jgi:hypothetical protein
MGVLACDRRGCTNIMCDRLGPGGYICDDCFKKLVETNPFDIIGDRDFIRKYYESIFKLMDN